MRYRSNYTVNRKPIHGFTLVELLVVISIMSLLMSILMPSLNKARRLATRIKCASNLHTTGIALFCYAGDYNGKYPLGLPDGSWPMGAMALPTKDGYVPIGQAALVAHNYLADFRVLYCPQHEKIYNDRSSIFTTKQWVPSNWGMTYLSYPYWVGFRHKYLTPNWSIPAPLNKLTALDSFSKGSTVVSSDMTMTGEYTVSRKAIPNHPARSNKPSGGNILYNDSSVGWKKFSDMKERFILGWEFYF